MNRASFDRDEWNSQRRSAKRRGIAFRLTFDQWLSWWRDELSAIGPDAKRGNRVGEYMMCRSGDVGAYEIGNIFCGTAKDNSADRATKSLAETRARWPGWPDQMQVVAEIQQPWA